MFSTSKNLKDEEGKVLNMKSIKVIIPVTTTLWNKPVKELYERIRDKNTVISIINLEKGPESIESYYDEAFAAPYVALEAEKAEREGYDAVIVYCFGNPGVNAARAAVRIPVFGIGEVSLMVASLIGNKFSIISTLEIAVPRCLRTVKLLGIEDKLASIRTVDIPVLSFTDKSKLFEAALEAGKLALKDGADVIVLGCGSMLGIKESLEKQLGIPVIDPGSVTLKIVEAIIYLGLSHSKRYLKHRSQKKIEFEGRPA